MRSIAYYGKLPSFGDFIQDQVPKRLDQLWEPWLRKGMWLSQETLGEAWMEHYLNGPVWRFLLGPGLVDQHYYAGLLVPSMDQVGRYFPFSVFLPVAVEEILDFSVFQSFWFNALETVLLHQLEQDSATTVSLLADLRDTMHVLDKPAHHLYKTSTTIVVDAKETGQLSSGFLTLLMTQLSNQSVWWTEGSERLNPCALLIPTWPSASTFTELFVGRWDHIGEGVECIRV